MCTTLISFFYLWHWTCHFQANFFTSTSFLCNLVRCSWVCFSKVRVQWCPLELCIMLYLSCCLVILAISCGWHLLSLFLLKTHRCFVHFVITGGTASMWISGRVWFLGIWRGKWQSFICAEGLQWEQGAKACSSGQIMQSKRGWKECGTWVMSYVPACVVGQSTPLLLLLSLLSLFALGSISWMRN